MGPTRWLEPLYRAPRRHTTISPEFAARLLRCKISTASWQVAQPALNTSTFRFVAIFLLLRAQSIRLGIASINRIRLTT